MKDYVWEIVMSKDGVVHAPVIAYENGVGVPERTVLSSDSWECLATPTLRVFRAKAKNQEDALTITKLQWEELIESGEWK
jgi:hypothetical protein